MSASRLRSNTRVVRTAISRPPRRDSFFVTAISLALLTIGALIGWSDFRGTENLLAASREAVFSKGEVWRLFTTLFVHADWRHLLSNSVMYTIMGFLLYGYFGLGVYPILAWVLAMPMTALALLTYDPRVQLIGASGLVHLMGGMWLSLYFCISRNLRLSQRLIRALGAALALFFPNSFEQDVSYRVHFIGLGFGLLAGLLVFYSRRDRLRALEEFEVEPPQDVISDLNSYYDYDEDDGGDDDDSDDRPNRNHPFPGHGNA